MKKQSLYRKYFSIYSMTLIVCTFMLGMILLYFASQYFREDKQGTLRAAAEKGVAAMAENLEAHGGQYVSRAEVEDRFELIERTADATVFCCDWQGRVILCSEGEGCIHTTYVIPARVLGLTANNGLYSDIGFLGGFFKDSGKYTCGLPVLYGGEVVGFVFASSSINSLFSFLFQMAAMFLVSSFIMLLGSSLVIYYATKILTRPLREMSEAAVSFGSGDFSSRVSVSGSDEIGELARVFNSMAESLSELETMRRSFVANVSHELRTPMTTIGGYIDGILDGTIPPEQQKHYLQIALDEVRRLSRLTTSLLSISRMEAGEQEVNIVSYNVWDIILNVMWGAERRITEKNIQVEQLDVVPRFVLCDSDMLHQVIYNLIDNAIKFTPEKGSLAVEVVDGPHDTTLIKIRNSGSGIAPEELTHIFERFYKTDKSRGLDKTGTGLGLYIVRTLTQRMEGEITAQSVEGQYAEFCVTLRTGIEDRPRPQPKKLPESGKSNWLDKLVKGFRKDDKQKDERREEGQDERRSRKG